MLSKIEFIGEIKHSISDVRDKQDCVDWWNSHVDAYIEDKIIPKSATKWRNPFLRRFK